MSQAGLIDAGASNPNVPTTFVTDNGSATPAAHILNVLGGTNTSTSGAGNTITIDVTIPGAIIWQDSGPLTMVIHNGYFATGAGAFVLPVGVDDGETIEIVDQVGGGVIVTAQGAQFIQIGSVISIANGTATSIVTGDGLRLVYRASAGKWLCTPGSSGNWIMA